MGREWLARHGLTRCVRKRHLGRCSTPWVLGPTFAASEERSKDGHAPPFRAAAAVSTHLGSRSSVGRVYYVQRTARGRIVCGLDRLNRYFLGKTLREELGHLRNVGRSACMS